MQIGIATPANVEFTKVVQFARKIYAERFDADISAEPDAFAYACEKGSIVGCLGMYLAKSHISLLFETYVPAAFQRISGNETVERNLCAEIGTRAVTHVPGFRSVDMSLALSAALFVYAYTQGIRYLVFTSNRTVRTIVHALELDIVLLGNPELSGMTKEFQEKWAAFFRVKQFCFGLKLDSIHGCLAALERLEQLAIRSRMPYPGPA